MRLINQIAFLVSIGCALFGLNPAEAQTLKLRYPLNDATANTYYPSDSSLGGVAANNLVTYNISGTTLPGSRIFPLAPPMTDPWPMIPPIHTWVLAL